MKPLERMHALTPCKASVVLHRKPSLGMASYCIVLCNTGMNTRWALTRRSLPDNRLIKTGGWSLTQGWALARDNTVYTGIRGIDKYALVHRSIDWSTEVYTAYSSIHEYTQLYRYTLVYTSIHGYTQVYTSIHWVYTSIHKYTGVCTSIHWYTQVYTGIQKYTRVYISIHGNTQAYTGIHKYTQVYTSIQKHTRGYT